MVWGKMLFLATEAQATQFSAEAGRGSAEKGLLINTSGSFKDELEARKSFGPRIPS